MTGEIYWQEFDAAWRAALDGLCSFLGRLCRKPAARASDEKWS